MYTIIGRKDCTWCEKAIEVIEEKGQFASYHSYFDHPLLRLVMKAAGMKTLPQIWYEGHYIGGYMELEAYIKNKESKL